jgi:ribosomal protein S6--L-glutamate ligase
MNSNGVNNQIHLGIISVRDGSYHPNKRLLEAAEALKHQAFLIHPGKFFMGAGGKALFLGRLEEDAPFDVILPRLGATIKEYGLSLVRQFELLGIPVINRYEAILLARNKFLTLQTLTKKGIPVPESMYVSNRDNLEGALLRLGGFPIVVKAPESRQGRGVFLIRSREGMATVLEEYLTREKGLVLQKYIPPRGRRDLRVFVVGQRIIGAIALRPKVGDFRANIHLDAKAEPIQPTVEEAGLALRSTKALGLDISGVDMLQSKDGLSHVLEVNYSPGFRGLEACIGENVATEIIHYAARSVRRPLCK